jgi:glutaminyl-tRNA synthetase
MSTPESPSTDAARKNFLEELIEADIASGRDGGRVHTRFPPEPNGYLHLGHAKAIWLDFGLAKKYGGTCNLRFDDTNPVKEDVEYVDAIQEDIRWLGFDWGANLYYASDWFERLYELASELIRKGAAYVCDLPLEDVRAQRGGPNEPGTDSPYRERSVEENLDLFARMRAGEFPEGSRTLRAKIDMASTHLLLRDPVMYRILHAHHHRTGDAWHVYPTYDWAHGQSDALEGITHSMCSLEFVNHRPLYDWFLDNLDLPHRPRQHEFARLKVTHVLLSKRKIVPLVEGGTLDGWDDPRLPTLRGMRRRGYTPEALISFCAAIGVTRTNSTIDYGVLENHLREDLNKRAERRMGVLRPLKVVITNWPEGKRETIEAVNNPEDPTAGSREIPLGRELWIERDDFREDAPKKYFRLAPGREVRLRYAYCITCDEVVKDASGEVVELRCTYDPATANGQTPDGRKVKGIIHWVPAAEALTAEVRLYEHLFAAEDPSEGELEDVLNPSSLEVIPDARLEPSLARAAPGQHFQLERVGYFVVDTVHSRPGAPVLNRAVALRDTWGKIERKQGD